MDQHPSDEGIDPLAATILAFWFGANMTPETVTEDIQEMWFWDGAKYDAEITTRFGHHLDLGEAGAYDHWCESPRGRLALLILLDQMPRHVHRRTPRAFGFDAKAREVCLEGIAQRQHEALHPIEQLVFFLPLEHSESMALQERCVAFYTSLSRTVRAEHRTTWENYLSYGVAHRDIIARFGHFPHRSAQLFFLTNATPFVSH
ncbi:MAG: DUF924 domain-containing protein, partial [Chromatiales bacterium]|nr:DUF924 domain-containing protein [Chromatiales bacterium]